MIVHDTPATLLFDGKNRASARGFYTYVLEIRFHQHLQGFTIQCFDNQLFARGIQYNNRICVEKSTFIFKRHEYFACGRHQPVARFFFPT